MSEAAILTEGLSKSFGAQAAVSELSLKIQSGAVYGFLGRNGAGKTTTMRMLLGLVRPTKGSARVLGLDPRKETELLRILERVGFVPQRKQLYGWATPAELVRMNKAYYPRWSDDAAAGLAKRLEIPMNMAFKKLSIGNQSKVALLLALAQGAEVLILDEPTAGLDPVMVDEILRTLIEDHISQGRTIFVSSHHLGEVEQICDWVGILEEGRLLLESRLEEIRQEFRLVIASGEGLPTAQSADVVSVTTDGRFCRYVVSREAERFAGELRHQGATILEISPIGLRELFLHLVRKEDPCTPGNAGAKAAPVSSFS
jgi:ABC-type multidrug transport system ATPase subunit